MTLTPEALAEIEDISAEALAKVADIRYEASVVIHEIESNLDRIMAWRRRPWRWFSAIRLTIRNDILLERLRELADEYEEFVA